MHAKSNAKSNARLSNDINENKYTPYMHKIDISWKYK